jgi:hypothetical protein
MSRVLMGCALALVLGGCSTGDEAKGPEEPEGVSFSMTTTIGPGVEVEHCKFVRGPAERFWVNRDHVEYTAGSHHFLLYTTPYDEIPTERDDGDPIEWVDEEQGVFDCSDGVQFGFSVSNLIGGSQNADGDSMVNLPDGVGIPVEGDSVLLMNAHYINASSEVLEPVVDVTLETLEEGEVQTEGGMLFWYNIFIKAPAMGTGYATARCNIPDDITITNTQSHMHARGVDYLAEVGDGSDMRMLYENTEWENVPVAVHDPGFEVAGGSQIEWTCDYDNPGTEDVFQGPRTTDEMCMLIGSYYPADPKVSVCAYDPEAPQATNFMGSEWVGQGETSCAESLQCFQDSIGGGGMFEILSQVTECVNASDPAVSKELSAAIGCSFASFMTGKSPIETCAPAYAACSAK